MQSARYRRTHPARFHLQEAPGVVKFIDSKRVAAGGRGDGSAGLVLSGDRVSVWEDEVLEMGRYDDRTIMGRYLMPLIRTPKDG